MQRKIISLVVAAVATFGVSVQVIAETTPEDAKGYRTSVMTALKGHVGASSMTVRGLVDDHGQLAGHAAGLASAAAELKYIFPEGSAVLIRMSADSGNRSSPSSKISRAWAISSFVERKYKELPRR
jgi:hypothetical protein